MVGLYSVSLKAMKLFFAIPLSILLLLQSVSIGVNDIIQINNLIEHAKFHNETYGDSLLVFISKHYGELKNNHTQNNPSEQHDHEKLPFGHQTCHHFFEVAVLSPFYGLEEKSIEHVATAEANFFYKEPYSSPYKSGIFQPPKHA